MAEEAIAAGYGRSQSMPIEVGRRVSSFSESSETEDQCKEAEEKKSAEEKRIEEKPAPHRPWPMPETIFRGIVKGGLTKEDIKQPWRNCERIGTSTENGYTSKRPPRRSASLPVFSMYKPGERNSFGAPDNSNMTTADLLALMPRRRSRRGNAALSHLAEQIIDGKSIVFITGAGLSVGSGIRPFRGKDGLWSEVVWSKATRESFRDDPLGWYNDFWLPHFPPSKYENHFRPNQGHEAIAKLAAMPSANVRVITQNVDGLHGATSTEWDWNDRLIEAHGRLGLYKCIPESDSDTDSDSDEEEDRPVKLGNRRKTRALREAYYRYGDGAKDREGEEGDDSSNAAKGKNSREAKEEKLSSLDALLKQRLGTTQLVAHANRPATVRASMLGAGIYMGVARRENYSSDGVSTSSSSSSGVDSDMQASDDEGKDGQSNTEERKVEGENESLSEKVDEENEAMTEKDHHIHRHVICRYELEESFPATEIEASERTKRIMLGEIPSDDESDTASADKQGFEDSGTSDFGSSSGPGSETETDTETRKPVQRGSSGSELFGGRRRSSATTDPSITKRRRRKRRRKPKSPKIKLTEPPMCPECLIPCPPQALLFDEGYHAHDYYQFELMEKWIASADVLAFVGTSFQVTITDVALKHAREKGVPVYNFNMDAQGSGALESTTRLNAENIVGDVQETLPLLWMACQEQLAAMGML